MQIQINPLVPAVVEKKSAKNGKPYEQLEISYKDLREGKVSSKKLMSFTYPDVFKLVQQAVPGTVYNVTLEKEGDYWQWTAFSEALGEPSGQTSAASTPYVAAASGARSAAKPVSNYETSEERAFRQRLIVRQSTCNMAIDILKHNSKNLILPDALFDLASMIEAHVYGTKEVGDPVLGLEKDELEKAFEEV